MALYHVTIAGRDRRHMTELGTRYRVLVVGYRELAAGGVEVDAYVDSSKTKWLEKHGIPRHASRRGRASRPAAAGRGPRRRCPTPPAWSLRRRGLGWWLSHGRRDRTGDGSRRGTAQGLRRADHAPASDMGETALPCLRIGNGPRTSAARDLLHWRRARARVGQCRHPRLLRHSSAAGLSRQHGHSCRRQTVYRDRRSGRSSRRRTCSCSPRSTRTAGISAWSSSRCGGRTVVPRRADRGARSSASTSIETFRCCGASTVISRRTPCRARICRATSKPTSGHGAASEPETRNVIWLLDRYPQIRYFVDLHAYGETILHSWGTDENQSDDPHDELRRMPRSTASAAVSMTTTIASTSTRTMNGRPFAWRVA